MSTTVDNRVVELKFNNKDFESNVKTSLKSIDTLKESMKFENATKGLEAIDKATKQVSFENMSKSIDEVKVKFDILDVAVFNIMNRMVDSAVNAGKKIVSSLTIDPVKTGFQEYETQINAVQTILANTQKEGTNVEIVNKALDELNTYSDKTIYNFTEMTRNIGTFTAAGVKLDDSVSAIKGIANLAAISGSTSAQASNAMYQLSQALAAGRVSLMDWNSVVNAGMGGAVFQDALKQTARAMGIVVDESQSFRDSIGGGDSWLSAEVLTRTLQQFTGDMDEAQLAAQGFNKTQIEAIMKQATMANEAATKVKTLTQLMDTLKEAAQSGWSQTWRMLVGDFEESRTLFTDISNTVGELIGKMNDARNVPLGAGLRDNWTKIIEDNDVFKNEEFRNLYTELLNERMGMLGGLDADKTVEAMGGLKEAMASLSPEHLDGVMNKLKSLTDDMTTEEREALGLNPEALKYLREYNGEIINGKKSMKEFQDLINQDRGRKQLVKSLNNIMTAVGKLASTIIGPFNKAFHLTEEGVADTCDGLEYLTSRLIISDEAAELLTKGFDILFTNLRKVTDFIGKYVLKAFGLLDMGVTEFVSPAIKLGNAIAFDKKEIDMAELSMTTFGKALSNAEKLLNMTCSYFNQLGAEVSQAYLEFIKMEQVQKIFKNFEIDILSPIENISEAFNVLVTSLSSIDPANIDFGAIISAFKNFSKSVSKESDGMWSNVKKSFSNGASDLNSVFDTFIKKVGDKYEIVASLITNIKDFMGEHSGSITAGIGVVGLTKWAMDVGGFVNGILEIPKGFVKHFGSIASSISTFINAMSSTLGDKLKAEAFAARAEGFKDIAIAVGILSLAIIAIVKLGSEDPAKLKTAAIVVGAMTAVVAALVLLISALPARNALSSLASSGGMMAQLIGISSMLLILSISLALLSLIKPEKLIKAAICLGVLMSIIFVFLGVMEALRFCTSRFGKNEVTAMQTSFVGMGFALLLMVGSLYLISKMPVENLKDSIKTLTDISIMLGVLMLLAGLAGKNAQTGATGVVMIAIAMFILVKMLQQLQETPLQTEKLMNTLKKLWPLFIAIGVMLVMTRLVGDSALKAGGAILAIAAAMLIMTYTMKVISDMSTRDLAKGIFVIGCLSMMIAALIGITYFAGDAGGKAALMLIGVSIALIVMTGILVLLSFMKPEKIAPGLIALSVLITLIGGLIYVTKYAGDMEKSMKMLTALTILIGVMVACIIALSFCDPEKVIVSATVLGVLLSLLVGSFAILTKNNKSLTTKNLIKIGATLALLLVVIGVLTYVIKELAKCQYQNVIASATGIGFLLLTMAASIAILSVSGKIAGVDLAPVLLTLAILSVILIGLTHLILIPLSKCDPMGVITSAVAIGVLLLALCTSLLLVGVGGAFSIALTAGLIGIAVLSVILAALIYLIVIPLSKHDFGAVMGAVIIIGTLLMYMCTAMERMGIAGLLAPAAILGMVAIAAFLALAIGLGYALQEFTGLQAAMTIGIEALKLVAHGMGEAVGIFIEVVTDSIVDSLPKIGTAMSEFMENSKGFIDGAKSIDATTFDGLDAMLAAMGKVMLLDIGSFVTDILTFGTEGVDLEESFGSLGKAIGNFNEGCGEINAYQLKAKAEGANALMTALSKTPKSGGIVDRIFGTSADLGNMGENIKTFGESIKSFSDTMDGVSSSAVEMGCTAGSKLMKMAAEAPNEGGLLGRLMGENGLSNFSTHVTDFGDAISKFGEKVENVKVVDIENATKAGAMIIDMANCIPNDGGLWGRLCGDNDLGVFSQNMMSFGAAVASFADTAGTIAPEVMTAAVNNAQGLMDVVAAIPVNEDGNFASDTVAAYGESLIAFAEDVESTYNVLEDLDSEQMSAIISKFRGLSTTFASLDETTVTNIQNMGIAITALANFTMRDFTSAFSGEEALINLSLSIQTYLDTMLYYLYNEDTVAPLFVQAGTNTMTSYLTGLKSNQATITTYAGQICTTLVAKLGSYWTQAYSKGRNFTLGFAQGIRSGQYAAVNAAISVAQAALSALHTTLDENSPSKITDQYGVYFDEGFANGIDRGTGGVIKSVDTLGTSVKKQMLSNVHKIVEMLEEGVETEPVIRPVMDLSNITQGIGAMNKTIGGTKVLDINARMNGGVQNGGVNGNVSTNVTYTQNNYSPKALSQADIYRQTKNLIAIAKG